MNPTRSDRRWRASASSAVLMAAALAALPAGAWERGLNAGSWTKGATLNGFVAPLPAAPPAGITQAILDAAVAEALKEWNDAQAPFGGLTLAGGATKATADIHISWGKALPEWGAVYKKDNVDKTHNGFTKETARVTIEINDGLDANGITRTLKHEIGHAEGLGHSAKSELMKSDAYSSTAGQAPTAADLNKPPPFIDPTADDKAGKKALWGTVEKLSKSAALSPPPVFNAGLGLWHYSWTLLADAGTGLVDPVTEFTLGLAAFRGASPVGVIQSAQAPTGWSVQWFPGVASAGLKALDEEPLSPAYLSFSANSASDGIAPGSSAEFGLFSSYGPGQVRAFTNSPSFDSDEFIVFAPVPEPGTLALWLAGLLGLGVGIRRARAAAGAALKPGG
ncbi:MAG: hypothetical protein Q8N44_21645 [Rubrivivax sp.]|nr:hypothetical protein [Rubrivivax sp.]